MICVLACCYPNAQIAVDIKPDNLLVNYDSNSSRFSRIALGDCGDVYRGESTAGPPEGSHVISAAIFRSPEAQLNLRWGPPTDIWSLGITVSSRVHVLLDISC